MAQFYWSAANEVVGSGLPAEFIEYGGPWTVEPHISDAIGLNSLRARTTGSYTWRRIEWAGETPADSAVVALMRGNSQGSTSGWGVFVRGQGNSNNAYALVPIGNTLRLWRTSGATNNDALGEFILTFNTAANACYLELEAIGTTIRGRAWLEGSPRPSWQIVTEDATYTSGTIGVGVNRNNTTIDAITVGVGTNGDPAPMEPVGEPIHLEALSTTATAADARLARRARLGAASEAVSAARGEPVRRIGAAATAAASTAATGSLARPVHLSAVSRTTTGATLQGDASIRLSATATVTTSASAGLRRWVQPVGITEATSSASGTLVRRVRTHSRAAAYTGANGAILRAVRVVGSARAASAAHATLSVGDPLPHPTTLGVTIEDIYTLGVTIEDIYTLAAIIED